MEFPVRKVAWNSSYRLIPSRFPPVDPYEPLAPRDQWDALADIERMTNPRLRDVNARDYLLPEDRGAEQNWIVAPFAYPNPEPTRFADGTFGYCAVSESSEAALADSVLGRETFLRRTAEPPTKLDMRMLVTPVKASLHDLTSFDGVNDHGQTRQVAHDLRQQKSFGLIVPSQTRRGEKVAIVLRPTAFGRAVQSEHFSYVWDGERISQVYAYKDGATFDPRELMTARKRQAA